MEVLNYASANTYIKTLRAIWQCQRERRHHLHDGALMSWREQNWAMTLIWNSRFSTLATKTFPGKSERSDSFFSPRSLENTLRRHYFVFTFMHAIVQVSLLSDRSLDKKKSHNSTKFASLYKKTKPCPEETNRTFAIYFKVTGMLNWVFQHPSYIKNKKQNAPWKA